MAAFFFLEREEVSDLKMKAPVLTLALASCPAISLTKQWQPEFAQFFAFPRHLQSASLDSCHDFLKPLHKRTLSSKGTWMASSSAASLQLITEKGGSGAVLLLLVQGYVHEEHCVSNLSFMWPQISCSSVCGLRGSRVVIVSYQDSSKEVQKFAMRFPSSSQAEEFISSVKHDHHLSLQDVLSSSGAFYKGIGQSDYIYDNSCISECATSNEPPVARAQAELSFSNGSDDGYGPEMQRRERAYEYPYLPPEELGPVFVGMPPSFTSLLNGTSQFTDQGNTVRPPEAYEKNDIRSQVVSCILDPSFQGMLHKVEGVLHEMIGDSMVHKMEGVLNEMIGDSKPLGALTAIMGQRCVNTPRSRAVLDKSLEHHQSMTSS
ncbi:protein POOR HOMOLOGOUS SYNAPSIS 1 isoform X3 [Amborella trichopoda]|uniref:protein POOR HOMOLOGOUS SYNAPSIS 1 isoform X3 n=1 Tax=Amborella trichopoda TaxID=13333 RepID=UPI0009C0A193|nr:protein POOR HOMOLOGOUS SYNAPSIS 1 isoform X3 [Amborella trichopoda]|eukprot:XP_020520754.1 protein POOR HOMOLOGOUS SYNAPSIS 1 isoform X3 [Amborella trichopoda]